jgi:hypothetical protein
MNADMTVAEATLVWNNLNSMTEEDFGGSYPIEVIEQVCEAACVLGLMCKSSIDGEVNYSLTEKGRNRKRGEDA